jgi:hypothetical protein
MVARFVIGAILILLVFVLIIVFIGGAHWDYILLYMDLSSLALMIVPSFLALIMIFTPREIKTAFAHVFSKETEKGVNYKKDIGLFDALQAIVLIVGVISFLTGIVILARISVDLPFFGRGISQVLLVFLYTGFISLLLIVPGKAILRKKQAEQEAK